MIKVRKSDLFSDICNFSFDYQSYQSYLDKLGMTYPQYLVLLILLEEEGKSVNETAQKLFGKILKSELKVEESVNLKENLISIIQLLSK